MSIVLRLPLGCPEPLPPVSAGPQCGNICSGQAGFSSRLCCSCSEASRLPSLKRRVWVRLHLVGGEVAGLTQTNKLGGVPLGSGPLALYFSDLKHVSGILL